MPFPFSRLRGTMVPSNPHVRAVAPDQHREAMFVRHRLAEFLKVQLVHPLLGLHKLHPEDNVLLGW